MSLASAEYWANDDQLIIVQHDNVLLIETTPGGRRCQRQQTSDKHKQWKSLFTINGRNKQFDHDLQWQRYRAQRGQHGPHFQKYLFCSHILRCVSEYTITRHFVIEQEIFYIVSNLMYIPRDLFSRLFLQSCFLIPFSSCGLWIMNRSAHNEPMKYRFLLKSKCIPVLLRSLEVCNLSKRDLQSLDFTVNRFFMKLFCTKDICLLLNVVSKCFMELQSDIQ